jgi:hypothetical protein
MIELVDGLNRAFQLRPANGCLVVVFGRRHAQLRPAILFVPNVVLASLRSKPTIKYLILLD